MNEHPNLYPLREAVYSYLASVRHSPTIREIAYAVGVSQGSAHRQVELLEIEGRIQRVGSARRIVVVRSGEGEGA